MLISLLIERDKLKASTLRLVILLIDLVFNYNKCNYL